VQDDGWARNVRDLVERQARARQARRPTPARAPGEPPRERIFHLFLGDHDFHDRRAYTPVRAQLRAAGKYCQVYVDTSFGDAQAVQATVDDAVRTFDREVYPRACERLGECRDVDGDGRFTILFTPLLSRMQQGKVALDGFVRGSDSPATWRHPSATAAT
jgi:hypothetical protein